MYTELHKGDSFEIEPNSTMNLACCDCNLVHKLIFKILDNGNISMKLKRNSKETAKKRKAEMGTIEKDITLNELYDYVKYYFEKRLDAKTIYRDSNTNSDVEHIKWEKLDK